MEFLVALLLRLCQDQAVTMSTAVSEVYTATLYKHHTWYTSAAFTVALKVWICTLSSATYALPLRAWPRQ